MTPLPLQCGHHIWMPPRIINLSCYPQMRLQKKFPVNLAEQLLSYGSCQFPTMGFVVERYKAITIFVKEAL